MSKVLIEEQTLYDLADGIRTVLDTDDTYKPDDMPGALRRFVGDPYENYLFLSRTVSYDNSNSKNAVFAYPIVNHAMCSKTQNGEGFAWLSKTISGGTSTTALYKDGIYTSGLIFAPKITAGRYNTLKIDVELKPRSSGWFQEQIIFSTTTALETSGAAADYIKKIYLANSNMTVDELNAQSDLIATRTTNNGLNRQIVQIDVSGIAQDYYVSIFNCDIEQFIYAMWFE